MGLFKKFKFGHFILILCLCLGTSIGLKVKKIYDVLYPNSDIKEENLIDSFDLDGKVFKFYQNGNDANLQMKLNGVNFNYDHGYYNNNETRHIYVSSAIYPTYIYQDGELLKPVKTIEERSFYRVDIYEFDINSNIHMICKTDFSKGNNPIQHFDYEQLDSIVSSWKKIDDNEDILPHYMNHGMLDMSDYDFTYSEFGRINRTYFSLMQNDKIIIERNDNQFNTSYYELTQEQYDEFIDFINNFDPQ